MYVQTKVSRVVLLQKISSSLDRNSSAQKASQTSQFPPPPFLTFRRVTLQINVRLFELLREDKSRVS